MTNIRIRIFLALLLSAIAVPAHASYWFRVPNAHDIQWLVDNGGNVWLRNLSTFDPSVLGCCYSYHIDTSTTTGRAMWGALQVRMAANESIWISVNGSFRDCIFNDMRHPRRSCPSVQSASLSRFSRSLRILT